MNATEALSLIREIANSPGRLDKQAGLEKLLATDLGKFILKWTYDSFITYGVTIKKPPASMPENNCTLSDAVVLRVLTELSTRELSGNAAKAELDMLFKTLDPDSNELLFMIINKDLKAGIAATTIEAVLPGFLPSFGVMRAHPYEDKRVTTFPVAVEPKLDGMRVTFIAKEGKGAFFTRSGKAIPALQDLAAPLLDAARKIRLHASTNDVGDDYKNLVTLLFDGNYNEPTFVLDTEAINGLFEMSGAMRRKSQKAYDAQLESFDLLPLSGFIGSMPYKVPYEYRRELLSLFVSEVRHLTEAPVFITPTYIAHSHDEIQMLYERLIGQTIANYIARGDQELETDLLKVLLDKQTGKPKGLEGAMVKPLDGAYEKKKSHLWLKIKPEETIDLFITGFFTGEANGENEDRMGGAVVEHKGVEVRVGGGWSSDDRDQLWQDWCHDAAILGINPKVGFKPAYTLPADKVHGRGFKFLGRMLEIEFNEVTPDGSLRHPRAIRFRDDKAGEVLREAA